MSDNENTKNVTEAFDRGIIRAFRIGLVVSVILVAFNILLAVMVFSEGLDYDGVNSKNQAILSVVGICIHTLLAILCWSRSRHPAFPWVMIVAGVWNLPIGVISIAAAFWIRHKLRETVK